jgi:hypothetical protein
MAHYHREGRLHLSDSREDAVEHAVQRWAELTEADPIGEVALISDASNQEIHRMNARAQHYRAERGELGDVEVPVPGVHYGLRGGDRVALIEQHREPGLPRIENGERGEVIGIGRGGEVLIVSTGPASIGASWARSFPRCASATPSTSIARRGRQ